MNPAQEREMIDALAAEMKQLMEQGPIATEVDAITAFQLIGLLQLALRHPELPESQKVRAREFIQSISQIFPPDSVTAQIIEMGWHPEKDIPPTPVNIKEIFTELGQKIVTDLNAIDPDSEWEIVSIEEML